MGMVRAGQEPKGGSELVVVTRSGWAGGGRYRDGWRNVR